MRPASCRDNRSCGRRAAVGLRARPRVLGRARRTSRFLAARVRPAALAQSRSPDPVRAPEASRCGQSPVHLRSIHARRDRCTVAPAGSDPAPDGADTRAPAGRTPLLPFERRRRTSSLPPARRADPARTPAGPGADPEPAAGAQAARCRQAWWIARELTRPPAQASPPGRAPATSCRADFAGVVPRNSNCTGAGAKRRQLT